MLDEKTKQEVYRAFAYLKKIGFSDGEKPVRGVRVATVNGWDPDLEREICLRVYVSVADWRSDYADRTEAFYLPGQEDSCLKLLDTLYQQWKADKVELDTVYQRRMGRT